MGLFRDRKVDLHMVFIDMDKAYDRVPMEVLWRCLEEKRVSPAYIRVIKDMYEGGRTRLGHREGSPTTSLSVWPASGLRFKSVSTH